MWLPPREELQGRGIATNLDEGVYDHPVVILSHQALNDRVVVLIVCLVPIRDSLSLPFSYVPY